MVFWILLAVTVCLMFYHTLEDVYLLFVKRVPPGPISLPLIGSLYKLDPFKPHVKLQKLIAQYGEVMSFRFGTSAKRAVFIHNTKFVEQIGNNIEALDRPDLPTFSLITPDGAGIGSRPYDKTWKFHTGIFKQALNKICKNSLSNKAADIMSVLFQRIDSKGPLPHDIKSELKMASMHIMASVCYGIDFRDWSDDNMQVFLNDHDVAMSGLAPFHPVNICPWIKHLPIGVVTKIKNFTKRRQELHQQLFDEHVANYTGEVHDMMDIMVEVMENGSYATQFKDSKIKKMELNNFFMSFTCLFMAGLDNLWVIMSWSILILAKNPVLQDKIYHELQQEVTTDNMVTIEMRKKLPYTEACVYEVLRISSSAPLGVPHHNRTELNVNGYYIPPGTDIFTNIWHIHNSQQHWTESDKVQPERFLDQNGLLKQKSDKIFQDFLPFGKGKRKCTGEVIVMDIVFLFISNIVRKYQFKTSEDAPSLVGIANMNHVPPKFQVIFSKRE